MVHVSKIKKGRNRRAFTIVEVLIAAFIAILIFGIGFTILRGIRVAQNQSRLRILGTETAQIFFRIFERDMASAHPGPWPAPDLDPENDIDPYPAYLAPAIKQYLAYKSSGVAGDVVHMTTMLEDTEAGKEFSTVRYFVWDQTDTLYREVSKESPPLDGFPAGPAPENFNKGPFSVPPSSSDPGKKFALLTGVSEFTASYQRWNEKKKNFYSWTGGNWSPRPDEGDGPYEITRATHLSIKLKILDPNESLSEAERTRIFWSTTPIPSSFRE